jgi:hypothetical protein
MKHEPAPDARCKDKFLVQSALIDVDHEFAAIPTIVRMPSERFLLSAQHVS